MDLDFVVEVQLIVEHVVRFIFAAIVKTQQHCQENNSEFVAIINDELTIESFCLSECQPGHL